MKAKDLRSANFNAFRHTVPTMAPRTVPSTTSYRMVIKIQSLIARPALYESIMMYNARYRNGNAIPSLLPDSADRRFRRWPGTRLANLPLPTTEEAKTGSVAETHAPTHNAST